MYKIDLYVIPFHVYTTTDRFLVKSQKDQALKATTAKLYMFAVFLSIYNTFMIWEFVRL